MRTVHERCPVAPLRLGASRQRGRILMVRVVSVAAVLMVFLAIPFWLRKDRPVQAAAHAGASQPGKSQVGAAGAVNASRASQPASRTSQPASAAPGAPAADSLGHGFTYAMLGAESDTTDQTAALGCGGDPAAKDQPHEGTCNPYRGDTSCRVVLPVLCLRPGAEPAPVLADGTEAPHWTGGTLAATPAVMGAVLSSHAAANARCEAALGKGWRMAEFHDSPKAWALQGQRGVELQAGTRYWVHVRDEPANCWNNASVAPSH